MSIGDRISARPTWTADLPALLWHVLTSPRFTLVLLLWLSGVIGLSQLIPQPLYPLDEPLGYSRWLASMPQFLWPLVDDLHLLGFFHLRTSVWLRLPLALLLVHALAMCADALPVAWQRTRVHRKLGELLEKCTDETPTALGRPLGLAVWRTEPPEHVFSRVMQQLAQDGYTVRGDQRAQVGLAWRWQIGWWALCSIYVGLALLATGLLLHSWLSRTHTLILQPGQTTSIPDLPTLALRLEDAHVIGDPLAPLEGVVQVRRSDATSSDEVLTLPLHAGRMIGGMWWTVVSIVPMVEVTARDAHNDKELELWLFAPAARTQPRARLSLSGEGNTSFASLPAQNVTLRVERTSDQEAPPGQFTLSFFHGVEITPAWTATLGNGDEVVFEGVRYRVSLIHDVQLRIQQGLWWVLAALGWLGVAIGGVFLASRRPVWLIVRAEEEAGGCHMTIWADTLTPHSPPLEWLRMLGKRSTDKEGPDK
ncbi:MAG: hypothetical protein ACUVSJ_04865 [Anaerolineae bacterium]